MYDSETPGRRPAGRLWAAGVTNLRWMRIARFWPLARSRREEGEQRDQRDISERGRERGREGGREGERRRNERNHRSLHPIHILEKERNNRERESEKRKREGGERDRERRNSILRGDRRPAPARVQGRSRSPSRHLFRAGSRLAREAQGYRQRPPMQLFGITSNTLVRSSQSSSGPAGGASDGYGLGRRAAGPDRRCTTTAAGAIRVIV